MREFKFRYVFKDKDSSDILFLYLTLEEIENNDSDWIYEQLENKYGSECNCLNESCSVCECDALFDDYEIISRDLFTGQVDISINEVYENDIVIGKLTRSHNGMKPVLVEWSDSLGKFMGYMTNISNIKNLGKVGNVYKNKDLL